MQAFLLKEYVHLIVPVLQIFVGLKELNCSWIKQGLKIKGWQQILQDKVGFNLSIPGERLKQDASEVTKTVSL